MFSKTFGYALRGILMIVYYQNEKRRIQVDEISSSLCVPRHFMSKVLKNLVKYGILDSIKGPGGGFFVNERTMSTSVLTVLTITDGDEQFKNCALRLHTCNLQNPCPLHKQVYVIREKLKNQFQSTTIKDLVGKNNDDFISSLVTETVDHNL
ncbi:MAG: RrF2 family transcriptional regulator [Flavisolibacter sp.]